MATYKQLVDNAHRAVKRQARADRSETETAATLAAAGFKRELEKARKARQRYHQDQAPHQQ